MSETKCLAFIWPAEDITGKETALANVKFITGPFMRKIARYMLPTNIYKYYYWGVTFEVVTLTDTGAITEVTDVQKEDFTTFGLGLIHALSYNSITHEVLGSNGFVYKLDQSLFYKHCQSVCEYIYEQIETANNIVMQMYLINGGIISISFDKDVPAGSYSYQFAIQKGFVTADNKLLRTMVPKVTSTADNKEVLKQGDIDKLIAKLSQPVGYIDMICS